MRILFLDDDEKRHEAFRAQCHPRHEVRAVRTVDEALVALLECRLAEDIRFDLALLDHDLGGKVYCPSDERSGAQVARFIAAMNRDDAPGQVVVHSMNEAGVAVMLEALKVLNQYPPPDATRAREFIVADFPFGTPEFWELVET